MKQIFKNIKGVSNITITTLVIVSLLVSIVGTWLVLESFQSKYIITPVTASKTQQSSGLVQLNIAGEQPSTQNNARAVGMLTLRVN